MNEIKNEFIKTFKQIASIPHPSGSTEKLRKFLNEYASSLGYKTYDDGRNLIVKIPATNNCSDQEPVIIQGHIDMVVIGVDESKINFFNDGLDIKLSDDQKYMYAENTSLGGDDGFAVCYMLMLMKEDNLSHPPLYLVFTDSEETGCQGAQSLDFSRLSDARYMINLDTESEGVLPTQSANCQVITAFCNHEATESLGTVWDVNLLFSGHGAHPVADLESGTLSPLKLVAQVLCHLLFTTETRLISIESHGRPGLLPNQCVARVLTNTDDEIFLEQLRSIEELITAACADSKKRPFFLLPISYGLQKCKALNPDTSVSICYHACFLPHEVVLRDENSPIASTAILDAQVTENYFKTTFQIRGKNGLLVEMLKNRLYIYYSYTETHFSIDTDVPGWISQENSELRERVRRIIKERTGQNPIEPYIHGFIEAGIFNRFLPGLDIVTFGPTVENIHSTDERMDLDSAVRVYELLKEVLKDFCPDLKEVEPTTIERVDGSTESIQSFYKDREKPPEETIPDCESCTIDCPFKN